MHIHREGAIILWVVVVNRAVIFLFVIIVYVIRVVQQVTEAVGLNGTIHRMVQFFSGTTHATSTFYVSQF